MKNLRMSKKSSTFAANLESRIAVPAPLQCDNMNKKAPEILALRLDIEREVKRKIRTPYDFEFLAGVIWERLHENISPTTLKRLWGYIDGADTTRQSTLNLLSRFLSYEDWEAYLKELANRSEVESVSFEGEGVRVSELAPGQRVEVTWLPNRRCIFRYDGASAFTVLESANAKLQTGDRFEAACFLVGQPMYLDNLVRKTPDGNLSRSVSYVAGSKHGLNSACVLTDE